MESMKELNLVREFDAPVALVWRAWTDEKLVAQWFGPRGVTNPVCRVDARKGGAIHIVMKAGKELGPAEGMEWPMKGTFDEVVPMKRLVFSSAALDEKQGIRLENRQTITFEEMNGKTKLTVNVVVTKVNPGAESAIAGMSAGFTQQLEKLGEFLRGQQ